MQQELVSKFGTAATFYPQTTHVATPINGIIAPPPIIEELLPGGATGTALIHFFVRWADISPSLKNGDTVFLAGIMYDVFDVNVDRQGGATIRLRKAKNQILPSFEHVAFSPAFA